MRFWWIRCRMPPCAPLPVFTPCAIEPRSTLRPTRAIQIFCCQRWAPVPRGITATGSEPAYGGEPAVSPRRAHSGGRSSRRSGRAPNLGRAVAVHEGLQCLLPFRFRLEPSRPPCGETERRPSSSAPSADAPRVDSPRQSFRSARAHASVRRLVQSSRPTDTPGALRANPTA
jgi:hypothetical protein